MLTLNNVEVIYNEVILVLKGMSMDVPQGKIVGLLGSNGAGKSTTLKAISGLLKAEDGEVTDGSIEFMGQPVHHRDAAEIVRMGIFQIMEGDGCSSISRRKKIWSQEATPARMAR